MKTRLTVLALFVSTCGLQAQPDIWSFIDEIPNELNLNQEAWVQPADAQPVVINTERMSNALKDAPPETDSEEALAKHPPLEISLPGPDGEARRFHVVETEIMHPDLALKFPEIRTFKGVGVDDPLAALRLDITPKGVHAQVLTPSGDWYIDPYWKDDTIFYTSYRKRALAPKPFTCKFTGKKIDPNDQRGRRNTPAGLTTGMNLRTYRLAVTGQGEYTAFHGGTVAGAMAAIMTTINRVNGIYERDLAVRLQLIANNNLIVYTNPATDPFTQNDSSGTTLAQNQTNTDAVIGFANYDVGHIFNTGGGGLAGLGVICAVDKAEGATGSDTPMGDAFDVDFVAHELGHQFGANHVFNGVDSNCSGDNRNGPTAYERGSGTTIMCYAGICGTDDVQSNSDDYFHAASLDEITTYLNTQSCEMSAATGNNLPSANAGGDFTIPEQTPFTLTASATDGDGDTLTYCWEQVDLGPAQAQSAGDNGSSPLFRSRPPSASSSRTFPQLSDILSNTSNNAEKLPTTTRTMNFRVTVRDNRAGGGGTDSDDMQVSVVSGGGPFQVTSPNTAVTIGGDQTVTWNVANTHMAPISTPNVNILLSTDGGMTFPTTLAANTPNDGSQMVTLPSVSSSQARIKIEGAGNIFFDI
ncbi:MAG: reprolysin-like metallopeptidase, partial [Verrucomicrobiota bacterium]